MTQMEKFHIKLLESKEEKEMAKHFIENNHYSHKLPQAIKFRFGMFSGEALLGVAIFSISSNQFAITSVFSDEHQEIGVELSRVFTIDSTPKNFESYCLSKMFAYIKDNTSYDVVLSYADPNFGHVGYLYQALNGIYLGQTAKEVRYILSNGQLITRRGLGRSKGDSESSHVRRLLESGAKKLKMEGKHKYIFFTCSKKRKKELLNKLKVNKKAYPKKSMQF